MAYSRYFETSTEYQLAVKSSEDRSSIEATFSIVPSAGTGLVSITGDILQTPIQRLDNSATGMSDAFASLEDGRIVLDGSFIWPAKAETYQPYGNEYWGVWLFPDQDVILKTYGRGELIPGVTIIFDDKADEYASHVTVGFYDDNDTLMHEEEITNNNHPILVVPFEVQLNEGYYVQITIDSSSWVGGYYIKVASLQLGVIQRFTGKDILSFEITEEGSPFNSSLVSPQATLTVDNSNGYFSILSSNGLTNYLRQAQPLSVSITIAGYKVIMCDWLLYDWSENHGERSATFVLKPSIGFENRFTKVTMATEALYDIIEELFNKTGISAYPYEEAGGPYPWDITANNYFGEDQQAIDAYQQIANAVACYWDTDREQENELHLIRPDDCLQVRDVTESVQLESPQISQATEYKNIVVQYQTLDGSDYVSHSYTLALSDTGESFTVYAPQLYTQAQAANLAVSVQTFLSQRVKISVPIKGDPALRPFDRVMLDIGDGIHTEFKQIQLLLTKVQTVYSDDVLQTNIEGIGALL